MPQTLPGSSSANPRSQSFSYWPIEMQFTTRAVTLHLREVALNALSSQLPAADRIERHIHEGLPESPSMCRKAADPG